MSGRLGAILTPLRARVAPVAAQLGGRWRALAERERVQIVAMVILVIGTATWLLLAKPALEATCHWQEELPKLRSQAAALKGVLAEAGVVGVSLDRPTEDPRRRMTASLAAAGLAGRYRLPATPPADGQAPAGTGRPIEIEFPQTADPAPALSWLMQAPPRLGLVVERFSIERDAAPAPVPGRETATAAAPTPVASAAAAAVADATATAAPVTAPATARITATLVAQ